MFQKITSKSAPDQAQTPPATPPQPAPAQQAAGTQAQQAAAAQPQATAQAAAGGTQRNILSNDVHIKGTVRFANDLLVDGRIEGEITSGGSLTVAENAHIKAEIKTKSVIVYGKVHGNISAADRIEIKSSAEVVGDLKAAVLSIEPGAIFVGKSEVGSPSAAAAPAKDTGHNRPPTGNEGNKGSSNAGSKAAQAMAPKK